MWADFKINKFLKTVNTEIAHKKKFFLLWPIKLVNTFCTTKVDSTIKKSNLHLHVSNLNVSLIFIVSMVSYYF